MVCSHKFVNFVMHTLEFASEEMLTISEISEFQERRMIKKKEKTPTSQWESMLVLFSLLWPSN